MIKYHYQEPPLIGIANPAGGYTAIGYDAVAIVTPHTRSSFQVPFRNVELCANR